MVNVLLLLISYFLPLTSYFFYSFGRPVLEEAHHFGFIVAVALFKETAVLRMDDLAPFVKHDEYGEAEAPWMAEPRHHLFFTCLTLHVGRTAA